MSHKCTDYLLERIEGLRKLSGKAIGYLQRIAELEQDGKRLDLLEKAEPHQWHEVLNNTTDTLRQAIDKTLGKEKGE